MASIPLLFIEHTTPTPDRDSGSMDTFYHLLLLQQIGYSVTFAPDDLKVKPPYTQQLCAQGISCLAAHEVNSLEDYLRWFGKSFQVVVLSRVWLAQKYLEVVRRSCPHARILYNTVDLHHLREQSSASCIAVEQHREKEAQASHTKEVELALVRQVDCTLVVSEVERNILLQEVPGAHVVVLPQPRPIPPPSAVGFHQRQDLVFIGGFDHYPNRDAVLTFLDQVWQPLSSALPGVRFFIAGSAMPGEFYHRATPHVVPYGYVDNFTPFLQRFRLSVAPLRYGAGVKGKLLTSLSHSLPCVATSIAAEGTLFTDGKELIIADLPQSFTDSIIQLYTNESIWQRLSCQGYQAVYQRHSLDAVRESWRSLLKDLEIDSDSPRLKHHFPSWQKTFIQPARSILSHVRHTVEKLSGRIPPPPALTPSQKRAYQEIHASAYFDEDWYRLAYTGQITYPDDLLSDYLAVGISAGRDPSPYFNTVLYRREHPVSEQEALLHFLESSKNISAGAYRSSADLRGAQRAFLNACQTQLVSDNRGSPCRWGCFLQCGSGSVWSGWRSNPLRTWDLLVNHYEPTYAGKIPCEVELIQTGDCPGTKFSAFLQVMQQFPHLLAPYDYILLLDDDVIFEPGDIERLFATIDREGWDLAQASLSLASSCAHQVFYHRPHSQRRQVNGVEIMMPVYACKVLGALRELLEECVSGWGLDAALAAISAEKGWRAAVIDKIIAQHLKPVNADTGAFYQMLHLWNIFPEIEFTHLQRRYRFTKPLFKEQLAHPAS